MKDHEDAEHQDPGQFDHGAPGHPVIEIIEKINSVATDSQDNEGIQLPEFLPGGTRGGGYRMVVHGCQVVGIGFNRLNINQISGSCKGMGHFYPTFNIAQTSLSWQDFRFAALPEDGSWLP